MRLVIDTETTGLPDWKLPADHPSQPRIAALAMILMTDEGRVVDVHHQLVRPDGWDMPEEAGRVNGLTVELLAEHGRDMSRGLDRYDQYLDEFPGLILVGHHVRFDAKMIRGELRRAGREDRFEDSNIFCTMKASTDICKLPPTNKMMAAGRRGHKPPNLVEALRLLCGQDLPDAHDCLADALAARQLYVALMKRGVPLQQRAGAPGGAQ